MPFDNTQQFDGTKWLNEHFAKAGLDFSDKRLQPVYTFALIWNLFEDKACNRNANFQSIKKSVEDATEDGKLKITDYADYKDYFLKRYKAEPPTQNLVKQLNARTKNEKNALNIGFASNASTAATVFALLLVAYRIRNNLFHGEKRLYTLFSQDKLFRVVNNLLTDYIDDINARSRNKTPY